MDNNPLFLKKEASHPKILIVSFAGYSTTTPQLNFVNFLNQHTEKTTPFLVITI
jgi:hypothetical protein